MPVKDIVPDLPELNKGEVYMRLVETAQRCDYPDGYGVRTDLTWYFQSIKKLGKGDFMFISGNWVLMNETAPAYISDENETVIDLWIQAMNRGAKIALFSSYYMVGDVTDCDNGVAGLDTGMLGGYTGVGSQGRTGPDGKWEWTGPSCEGCGTNIGRKSTCIYVCCQIKKLKEGGQNNFINLISTSPLHGPSSHIKHISFLYKNSNTFSMFFGAWNPVVNDWPLKETGFGMVGNLSDDVGKYLAYFDYKLLEMLMMETNEAERPLFETARSKVAELVPAVTNVATLPEAPVNIPALFVYGPDYCDPNLGCDIDDKYGRNNQSNCGGHEKFSSTVDTNVKFTISVAPSVTHFDNSSFSNCVADGFENWGWGGPNDKQIKDATTLIVNFIDNSNEYVKTAIMSQFLGNPIAPSDDFYRCGDPDYTVKLIADALIKKAKSGVPLFAMCSDGDFGAGGGDGCNPRWGGDLKLGWELACDKQTGPNFYVKNYGYGNTHDKFWVNEDSFILSTGHPNTDFHMTLAYNYWNLFQNAPNLTTYMNNHWNYMWTHCADYNFGSPPNQKLKQLMQGKTYSDDLKNKACPSSGQNDNGCCRTGNEILRIKDYGSGDYYGSPYLDELRAQIPDPCQGVDCGDHGACKEGECVCRDGYSGKNCRMAPIKPVDPCRGVDCGDHGACSGGKCVCTDGYTGDHCQNPPAVPPSDPCYGVNCGDHGTCKDGKCVCKDGYSGKNCKTPPTKKTMKLKSVYIGIGILLVTYFLLIFLFNKRK